jgi:hypothetical protein
VSSHDIAIILNGACCWRYCCCLCHCCCLHPDCGRHSCCCWRPLSSWGFPVAGLFAIVDVPGVTTWCCWRFCFSFQTCCPWQSCCYWLSCFDSILAVASLPADPGV